MQRCWRSETSSCLNLRFRRNNALDSTLYPREGPRWSWEFAQPMYWCSGSLEYWVCCCPCYKHSKSLVHIASSALDFFQTSVGLYQDYPLSSIWFAHSQNFNSVFCRRRGPVGVIEPRPSAPAETLSFFCFTSAGWLDSEIGWEAPLSRRDSE